MNNIKEQFPILKNGIIYLDSASTTQKPTSVINSITQYYETSNANVHRGLYPLAQKADQLWNNSHIVVSNYIGADKDEIFFVKNATEGINWIAQTYANQILQEDDIILISEMEHHSNILPWKLLAKKNKCKLIVIPIDKETKTVDINILEETFKKNGNKIKVVSIVHMSNVLGSTNDIKRISKMAHEFGAIVVTDGTQSIVHMNIDVKDLDTDLYIFSGHKIYGPTGIGVVYCKRSVLDTLEPVWQGGEMVDSVDDELTFKELPYRFESGTPNIEGAIGLAVALDFLKENQNLENERTLSEYMYSQLKTIDNLKIISIPNSPIFSFTVKGIHHHDIAGDLGQKNICVRAGYHCTQPLHKSLGLTGSVRISLGIYNTKEDIDELKKALIEIIHSYE